MTIMRVTLAGTSLSADEKETLANRREYPGDALSPDGFQEAHGA